MNRSTMKKVSIDPESSWKIADVFIDTYTPSLDEDTVEGDAIDYSSPPFRPEDSNVAQPLDHEDGDDGVLHALPVGDTSNPHDPTSNEAQDASEAEGDFTEVTDEESSSEEQSPYPGSFEEDPDPTSTTACTELISSDKPLVQYALTIDAGSTGSRIHVYKFNNCGPSPQLEYETFMAVKPGLSAYARDPTAAAASLDPLLEEAYRVVPESLRKCTPVEVKATAGLRLLGQQESVAILDEVRNRLETNWDFTVNGDRAVEIMDGKDEGKLLLSIGARKQRVDFLYQVSTLGSPPTISSTRLVKGPILTTRLPSWTSVVLPLKLSLNPSSPPTLTRLSSRASTSTNSTLAARTLPSTSTLTSAMVSCAPGEVCTTLLLSPGALARVKSNGRT